MITFTKIINSDIPEDIRKRVKSWNKNEVVIDDDGITRAELKQLTDLLIQEGFKEA